jgi:hypothetical protein
MKLKTKLVESLKLKPFSLTKGTKQRYQFGCKEPKRQKPLGKEKVNNTYINILLLYFTIYI